jgi:hypothetical protein
MVLLGLLLAVQIAPLSPEVPNRQPHLDVSENTLVLTYGAGNSVFFTGSRDSGRTWRAPVLVATPGKLSLGARRGPRIAATPRSILITAIAGEKGGGADGDLLAWRSTDGGATWSEPTIINEVPGSAREGLHGMASGGNTIFVAWLDLRSKGTKLFGAVSLDGGAGWSENRLVYESPSGSICECCHPTVAIDGAGRIYVLFRNSREGNRDMYLTRSDDGARTFNPATILGDSNWKLNACPMDGGDLAIGRNGEPLAVWRRDKEIFLTKGGSPELRIGSGRHPVIAMTAGGPVIAWNDGRSLKAFLPGEEEPRLLSEGAAYASLKSLPGGRVIAAWESSGAVSILTLPGGDAEQARLGFPAPDFSLAQRRFRVGCPGFRPGSALR